MAASQMKAGPESFACESRSRQAESTLLDPDKVVYDPDVLGKNINFHGKTTEGALSDENLERNSNSLEFTEGEVTISCKAAGPHRIGCCDTFGDRRQKTSSEIIFSPSSLKFSSVFSIRSSEDSSSYISMGEFSADNGVKDSIATLSPQLEQFRAPGARNWVSSWFITLLVLDLAAFAVFTVLISSGLLDNSSRAGNFVDQFFSKTFGIVSIEDMKFEICYIVLYFTLNTIGLIGAFLSNWTIVLLFLGLELTQTAVMVVVWADTYTFLIFRILLIISTCILILKIKHDESMPAIVDLEAVGIPGSEEASSAKSWKEFLVKFRGRLNSQQNF